MRQRIHLAALAGAVAALSALTPPSADPALECAERGSDGRFRAGDCGDLHRFGRTADG